MQSRIFFLYRYSLLILLLNSLYAWFLWGTNIFSIFFAFLVSILFYAKSKSSFCFKDTLFSLVLLLAIIEFYEVRYGNLNASIAAVLRITILTFVLALKDQIKIDLFHFFTKAIAWILAISLIGWILYLTGVNLAYSKVIFSDDLYSFYNYYFFILIQYSANMPIPRFSGVFLEPSYLGMIASMLIIANRFDLKKMAVWVFILATIFSFSLSAFIILIIILVIFLLMNSKRPLLNIILMGSLFGAIVYLLLNQNNGNNIFNFYITERLKWEDGNIVGYNRYSDFMDIFYERFMNSNDKYFGIGIPNYQLLAGMANAGYKVFLVTNGIVGTFLVFLFYISVVLRNRSNMAWIFFITYFLIFLNAAYPLMECQLLIFITAMPVFKEIKQKGYNGC